MPGVGLAPVGRRHAAIVRRCAVYLSGPRITTVLHSGAGTKPSFSFSLRIGSFRSSLSVSRRSKPAALRGRDLGALERGRDTAPAPVAPGRRQAVERLLAERLQSRVADDLVARERDKAELGPAGRLVDLVRPPLLEVWTPVAPGMSSSAWTATAYISSSRSGSSTRETIRTPGGGSTSGGSTPSSSSTSAFSAPTWTKPRCSRKPRDSASLSLTSPWMLSLSKLAGAAGDLGEHRRADPLCGDGGDDRDVAGRDRAPRLDEGAGDGLVAEPGDEVAQVRLCLEVVAQVLDRGGASGVTRRQTWTIASRSESVSAGVIGKLRELVCVHVMSS